jgi:hypothetical protein
MIECSSCRNDARITQATGAFYRDLRVTVTRGGATFQKSIWKTRPDRLPDGFACKACGEVVSFPSKWIKAWKLDDAPATVGSTLDVDNLLREIKTLADGATLNLEERAPQGGSFRAFSSLGVELPEGLADGAVRRR